MVPEAPKPPTPAATGRELQYVLGVLRKRWRIVVTVLVVCVAVAIVFTLRQPKVYEAIVLAGHRIDCTSGV